MTVGEIDHLIAFGLAGLLLGGASLAALRLNASLYLGGGLWWPIGLHLARLAIVAGALVWMAQQGASPSHFRRRGPSAGTTNRRAGAREDHLIASPLTAEVLFRLGPIPITMPVVVTWGLMAVLTLISMLATRKLRLDPGPGQAALELLIILDAGPDPRDAAGPIRRPICLSSRHCSSSSLLPTCYRWSRGSSHRQPTSKPTPPWPLSSSLRSTTSASGSGA